MPIVIVVQSAETLTFLLSIALCVRIFTLYRASIPKSGPPRPEPIALPKPVPTPSLAPPDVLETYISEMLGTTPMAGPYLDASPEPVPDSISRHGARTRQIIPRQQARAVEAPPETADAQACQSIAHFLLSRRFDTESV